MSAAPERCQGGCAATRAGSRMGDAQRLQRHPLTQHSAGCFLQPPCACAQAMFWHWERGTCYTRRVIERGHEGAYRVAQRLPANSAPYCAFARSVSSTESPSIAMVPCCQLTAGAGAPKAVLPDTQACASARGQRCRTQRMRTPVHSYMTSCPGRPVDRRRPGQAGRPGRFDWQ